MDLVAERAATSKRSLYAHFESKDKLFLAVVNLVRELYLGQLKTPGDYAGDSAEAVVLSAAVSCSCGLCVPKTLVHVMRPGDIR